MHDYLNQLFWFNVGKFGAVLVIAGASWLSTRRWLPHRHSGYVTMNGYVRGCRRCGKLPAGAYHAGFRGMIGPDGYDRDGYDRDGYDKHGYDRDGHTPEYAYALRSAMDAGFAIGSSQSVADWNLRMLAGQPESDDWVTCPSCGREDVAARTMRDGECIRCWTIHNEHAPMA